jgi:four helix bundle protein
MPIHDYRDLIVWQKAVDLTELVYELVRHFPAAERYGLCSQLTRAAVSVASNIAEGNAFNHRAHYVHHVDLARGSLYELATQLEIARRLTYVQPDQAARVFSLIDSISRMLYRLRTRLRACAPSAASRPIPHSPRHASSAASPRPPPVAASLTTAASLTSPSIY